MNGMRPLGGRLLLAVIGLLAFAHADPGTFVHIDCPPYASGGVLQVNVTLYYQNGQPYPCAPLLSNDVQLTIVKPDKTTFVLTPAQCSATIGLRQYAAVVASATGSYTAQVNSPFAALVETCQSQRVAWTRATKVPELPPLAILAVGVLACLWAKAKSVQSGKE